MIWDSLEIKSFLNIAGLGFPLLSATFWEARLADNKSSNEPENFDGSVSTEMIEAPAFA